MVIILVAHRHLIDTVESRAKLIPFYSLQREEMKEVIDDFDPLVAELSGGRILSLIHIYSSSFSDVVGKISEGEFSLITPEEMKNPENRDMCEQNLALYLVRNGMYQLPFEYSDELEEYLRWDMISEEIQINGNWELVKVNNRWFAVSIEV